jgi:hypothetical protein
VLIFVLFILIVVSMIYGTAACLSGLKNACAGG